jgi:Polysaccharide pyruvyl transferase
MQRILLRAHKHPFVSASAERTARRNLIGDNAGNLIFSAAAYKLLDTSDVRLETATLPSRRTSAAAINDRYDALVLPLANAFRPSFRESLDRLSDLIEALTIPVVVLGVGAQLNLDGSFERLTPMRDSVTRFVRAVLDHGPSIGVRGEFTADYVRSLGFTDVDAIGCPSLFLHGEHLRIEKRATAIDADSPIALTLSPYLPAARTLADNTLAAYRDVRYVAQDVATLRAMVQGHRGDGTSLTDPAHPLLDGGRGRFYVDPTAWIDDLRQVDFAFGTRIHGGIAALLAGTPTTVLAHDSRTLELARYFGIPHRPVGNGVHDPGRLYAEADFSEFNDGHAARFAAFTEFLARHGLQHAFEAGQDATAFDRRMAARRHRPAVTVRSTPLPVRPWTAPIDRLRTWSSSRALS